MHQPELTTYQPHEIGHGCGPFRLALKKWGGLLDDETGYLSSSSLMRSTSSMANSLKITRLLFEIVSVIVIAETAVMFAMPVVVPGVHGLVEALLDAVLLSVLAGPFILWRMHRAFSAPQAIQIHRINTGERRIALIVAAILMLGLFATVAASVGAAKEVREEAKAQYERLTDRLSDETERRVNQVRYGLAGSRGTFASIGELNREQFKRYVESRHLPSEFPGAIGMGFIERVNRNDLDAFIESERADRAPDFNVYGLAGPDDPLSNALDLYVIKHCFPQDRNAKAWGLDIGSETQRRLAAERSARTGKPSISGRIELVQDGKSRTAFLYYLPIYRVGAPQSTPEERLDALVGLAYSPIILEETLGGVTESLDYLLDFEIYDGPVANSERQLYDKNNDLVEINPAVSEGDARLPMFTTSRTLQVGGREWTMITSTTPRFESSIDNSTPALIAIGGSILSFSFAGFIFSILTSRSRAIAIAEEMTNDLKIAKVAAEEAMRETAAFRATLDQHSIISVADRQGRIIDVNPPFCSISGYTHDELIGKDHRVLNSGLHPKEFWIEIWSSIRSGKAWRGEICNRAKDGSLYWVDSIIAPFVNAQGEIEKYVSIRSDVTARKRGEADMISISERLRLATQVGGVGIWEYDIVENKVTWDDQMYTLYGVSPDQFGGAYEAWAKGLHPDDRDRSHREIQAAIQGEREFDTEFRVRHPDGTVRSIRAIATVQRDAKGNPLRMIGTNWDVTSQRLAAMELQATSDLLEEAQAVTKMGNWTHDLISGRITWSKQLFSLFDRDIADGPPDFEGLLGDFDTKSAQDLREAVIRTARTGEPYSLVMRTSKPANGVKFVRGEGRARFDAGGSVIGLFGTAIDVTDEVEIAESLRQAQIDAEAANRSKSAFLANMSHEIRTPLTAILGFTEMLRDDENFDTDSLQRSQAIETIHNAGNHLMTVINDILDLSKIEAEKMTIETIETPVTSMLRDIEILMGPRATGKGISLDVEIGNPVPDRIMSDPTRLRQILMNLVGNAIKFTEDGRVTLRVRTETRDAHDRFIIEIEDTGPGLDQDQAEKLFEAFGQANETVSRKHGGTGLGLTICRRLAGLMGGTVRLIRTEPGHGACFEVDLPLQVAPDAKLVTKLDERDEHESQILKKRVDIKLDGRILLAEDGPDNQRLIAFHLRKAGATVEIADNGIIALEMLSRAEAAGTPFDLLLTDIQMPEMDGYSLVSELRKQGNAVPIVALTAHAMQDDRIKCEKVGCDDFASKPIDRNQLVITCAKWIESRESVRWPKKSA